MDRLARARDHVRRASLPLLVGCVLFCGLAAYTTGQNATLKEQTAKLQQQVDDRGLEIARNRIRLSIMDQYLGTRLEMPANVGPNTAGPHTGSPERNRWSLIIALTGSCSACFESEAVLWSDVAQDLGRFGIVTIGVNAALDPNLVTTLQNDGLVTFTVLPADTSLRRRLERHGHIPVLAFLMDGRQIVRKIHCSVASHPEVTAAFCDALRSFVRQAGGVRGSTRLAANNAEP